MKNKICFSYLLGFVAGVVTLIIVNICVCSGGKRMYTHDGFEVFDQEIPEFKVASGEKFIDVMSRLFAMHNEFHNFEASETVSKCKVSELSVTGISFRQLLQLLCADVNCECLYSPIRSSLIFIEKGTWDE